MVTAEGNQSIDSFSFRSHIVGHSFPNQTSRTRVSITQNRRREPESKAATDAAREAQQLLKEALRFEVCVRQDWLLDTDFVLLIFSIDQVCCPRWIYLIETF